MSELKKPIFDKTLFWDVNFEKIDYQKRASWVIERVFDRGDIDDIRQCRRFYGDEKVKEVLLNAKYISINRLHLIAAVVDEDPKKFRCYTNQQSNQSLFPY